VNIFAPEECVFYVLGSCNRCSGPSPSWSIKTNTNDGEHWKVARKVDALDQWCLRRILDIHWYHHISNCEVRRLTEQPPLTTIIQKRRLTLFGHLVRMDKSTDARRILTAVPQSEWRRPVGRPYTSWMATLKNDLARHNLTLEDAIELALNKPLWRLLAARGATHWWCMLNNDDDDEHWE